MGVGVEEIGLLGALAIALRELRGLRVDITHALTELRADLRSVGGLPAIEPVARRRGERAPVRPV